MPSVLYHLDQMLCVATASLPCMPSERQPCCALRLNWLDCRFLWQLQYLVSQGFYVLLDWSSTRDNEVNMQNPEVLAQNWGNLWKTLTDIPAYKDNLAGRIFPDLVNEPRQVSWHWPISGRLL